jgi:hypothetical protein
MSLPKDQIAEVKQLCPNVRIYEEAGCSYLFLPGLNLPDGCSPASVDALLCPSARDGYPSRLFVAERVKSPTERNWNANGVRIAERNWQACSWKTNPNLRLIQMIAAHLGSLR